jgi:HSP20 family protein
MNKTSQFCTVALLIASVGLVGAQTSSTPSPTATASPLAHSSPSPYAASSPFATPETWDPMADMERMQTEMNQFFSRAMGQFGLNPNVLAMRNEPGFASSLDVRDKGDHYEVDAFLPGAEINNVKVTADSNNSLRVTASESKQQKKNTKQGEESMSEFGEYQQVVTLPGPARTKDMKVNRTGNEVVITVPKKTV